MKQLRRMPRWAVFFMIAAFYTTVMLGQSFLMGEALEPSRILLTGVAGLVAAGGALGILHWQRARDGRRPVGSPTVYNFRKALSTGHLPQGATAERWIPELTKTIRQERHMTWVGPLVFGAFAALGIYLIVENPDHPWFWVISTAAFAGLAIAYPIWTQRRRRRMQTLIHQFDANDGHPGTTH